MLRSLTKDGKGGKEPWWGAQGREVFIVFSKNGKMKLRYSESVLHM